MNELVRRGIIEFGLGPIFRTLARIFEESRDNFVFLPGVELIDDADGVRRSAFEADIVWIKDGDFGVAEVKTNTRRFRPADAERLIQLSAIARPDVVVLAAPSGSDAHLTAFAAGLQRDGLKARVVTLGPSDFDATEWHYTY